LISFASAFGIVWAAKSHQAHLEWPPSRLVNWARTIGPHTAELFERILSEKPHPEMGHRSCLEVEREGYSSGKNRHAAPVCRIQRMPSKQARFGAAGKGAAERQWLEIRERHRNQYSC
jgi:hypothetical protein